MAVFGTGIQDAPRGAPPRTRADYWLPKITKNRENERNNEALEGMGWGILTIWQCELRAPIELEKKLVSFLENDNESR
jgi:DNA mismatch endonuclease, patch repair protein